MAKKVQRKLDRYSRFHAFYALALDDYLACRVLLRNELLAPGVGMAATGVEKIIKAILALRGEYVDGHLKIGLLNSLKNYKPDVYSSLNEDYLKFLIRAYKLRYLDNFRGGHSLVISKYRTLAEADKTMVSMFQAINVEKDGEQLSLGFDRAEQNQDTRLISENFYLATGTIEKYFQTGNLVEEIKVFGTYTAVKASYRTPGTSNEGSFNKPAVINNDGKNGWSGKITGG